MTIFTKPVSIALINRVVAIDRAALLREIKAKSDAAWEAELALRAQVAKNATH